MLSKTFLSFLITSFGGLHTAVVAASRQCPPLGPVLPAPRRPAQHAAVKSAIEGITASLKTETGFNYSAISIGVQSIFEDAPLLDFHHSPPHPDPNRGTNKVNASTVYRIGSISKVFTVLAALQLAEDGLLNMNDAITRWIPELSGYPDSGNELDEVNWEEVTVESVAAHLSGIGADIATDLAAFDGDWEALGLPSISAHIKALVCSGMSNLRACTAQDLLNAYQSRRPPVYPPFQSPVYSNSGTSLLGLVVEAASNRTFEEFIRAKILSPLGMHHTTIATKPEDVDSMFIPVGSTDWNRDLGVFGPSGGMNSNTADLLSFMIGILKNRLLSPSSTRHWLKPASFTSGWSGAVGAPWEIYRLDNLTSDSRIFDLYTKGGTLTSYHSEMALMPDLGFAISVLSAGPEVMGLLPQLLTIKIAESLISAMDLASRDEARKRFVGTYVHKESNSRLTLEINDGPGLVLSDWFIRGFEVLPNLDRYSPMRINSTMQSKLKSVRMYPTGLETKYRSSWRATFPTFTDQDAEVAERSISVRDATCVSWFMADRITYNYLSMDHFEFRFGEDEETALSIKSKAFDVEMVRVFNKTQGH
ncbi:uncharacterized protein FRV6_13078 [Fusarium oxysporum]|uniref:Uncharacterized protein n=1 Tax=Fusarium oxysporum TaxID=5507 RepID=A0A2H3TVZ6_FUSOX|nr:uncharacterized protein FRV6_13078 [Fusarium oxysporum]